MKTNVRLLENVKAYIPPAELYRAELPTMPPPRGGGWRDGGLCPFHADNHAGSFRVNLDSGGFQPVPESGIDVKALLCLLLWGAPW